VGCARDRSSWIRRQGADRLDDINPSRGRMIGEPDWITLCPAPGSTGAIDRGRSWGRRQIGGRARQVDAIRMAPIATMIASIPRLSIHRRAPPVDALEGIVGGSVNHPIGGVGRYLPKCPCEPAD
jgi:hypothetical protein